MVIVVAVVVVVLVTLLVHVAAPLAVDFAVVAVVVVVVLGFSLVVVAASDQSSQAKSGLWTPNIGAPEYQARCELSLECLLTVTRNDQ